MKIVAISPKQKDHKVPFRSVVAVDTDKQLKALKEKYEVVEIKLNSKK